MSISFVRGAAGLLLLALSVVSSAAPAVDGTRSKVTATFRQMKVPVEGAFTRVAGSIVFDATNPAAASARIDIDTASFDLGMDDYNAEVRKKEWFDSATHPRASFVSSGFRPLGGDRYEARGTLSIKGRSQTVTVPVTVRPIGTALAFDGTLPVSRKAFGIGDASWDEMVEDPVHVQFHIVQPR